MQYTYFGTCDDIEINKSDNDKFTQLILNSKLNEAVEMINNVKDLKFNGTDLNFCYNKNHILCNLDFKSLMDKICANDDYVSVITLLQFLITKNIIVNDSNEKCNTIVHDYDSYCAYCIYRGYINTAKVIYIMFNINNLYILLPPYYHYTDNALNIFKITYNIILQCQDIIPLKRRGLPYIDISMFVEVIYRKQILSDIIEWYYTISPTSYTKEKITKTLEKTKRIKKINSKQLARLEKFFDSII